jgi:hypothetical protein
MVGNQSGTVPAGFSKSIQMFVNGTANPSPGGSDYALFTQRIEGYRVLRLGWGTANAQPITIGFWVFAARPGSYSGAVRNDPTANRTYVFSFTINVANTWEWKTITIPGDTTGTWNKDNTTGLMLMFTMMAGTSMTTVAGAWTAGSFLGATGTINGVASTTDTMLLTGLVVLPGIEAPSAARSALIMRPYDQELVTCKRYWQSNTANCDATAAAAGVPVPSLITYSTEMRSNPVVTFGTPSLAGNNTAVSSLNGSAKSVTVYVNSVAAGRFYWVGPTISDARL